MKAVLLLLTLILILDIVLADYVPGQPGRAWSKPELLIVKAKLFRLYHNSRLAPPAVRLAFHDCLKYADGTGGCDGCLNWNGVDVVKVAVKFAKNESNIEETDNNGLGKVVRELERVYREADYPNNAPKLGQSLFASGKSRADLWAFAGIVGTEFGMETNNIACENWRDNRIVGRTCVHDNGTDCKIRPSRAFQFEYGRADCTNHDSTDTYKTMIKEHHPNPVANGRATVKFFKDDFNFSSRETAAIFGAHTFGKPHVKVSLFPYTWTSSGISMFNNDYYKSITGQPRWFFDDENCNRVGDAFGNKPQSRWLAHTRKMTQRGGPVFWIHQNLVCPSMYNPREMSKKDKSCVDEAEPGMVCKADPTIGGSSPRTEGQPDGNINKGCERFKLIPGRDEIALNCEMGLYREFDVDNGVIHGCPGLEHFNASMAESNPKKATWSKIGKVNAQPECPKQRLAEPIGSTPLYIIMEEYANDQTVWINDYMQTMEKMMRNGYPKGLNKAPDHNEGVRCDLPTRKTTPPCYERSEALNMQPIIIGSRNSQLAGKVYHFNNRTRNYEFETMTGSDNQLWRISLSGDQVINLESDEPLNVEGNVQWLFERDGDDYLLINPVTSEAVDCR